MKSIGIIIIASILIFLLGCDKVEESEFPKGNIVGFVNLFNEDGKVVENKSDVNVSLEGLDISANTTENGRFELTNVPAGTYNIIFNKGGLSTYKMFSYQFIGGNVPALLNKTNLYLQPNIEIQNLDITLKGNVIDVSGTISEAGNYYAQIFLSDSSNVSNLNYHTYGGYRYCCFPTDQFSFFVYLDTHYLPGDEVYLVLYFVNYAEQSVYYDYEAETYLYTSYKKATNVLKVIAE